MTIMEFIGGAVIIIGLLSIIVGWLFYLIQWIVCRKKVSCSNENCRFRLHCIHSNIRKMAQLEYRKRMLEEYMKNNKKEEE